MRRVSPVVGLGMLLSWLGLVIFPPSLGVTTPQFPFGNPVYSAIAVVSILVALIVLMLQRHHLEEKASFKASAFCAIVFIASNGLFSIASGVGIELPILSFISLALASVTVGFMLALFLHTFSGFPDSATSIMVPGAVLITSICTIVARSSDIFPYVFLFCFAIISGLCIFVFSSTGSPAHNHNDCPDEHRLSTRPHGATFKERINLALPAFTIILILFVVFSYNMGVATATPVAPKSHYGILAIALVTITSLAIIAIQEHIGHPLFLSSLLGVTIAVQGLIIMAVEPLGSALIPAASIISASLVLMTVIGIINLSLQILKTGIFNEVISLTGLFMAALIGSFAGFMLVWGYGKNFESIPFVRIVFLCVLLCPYAFFIVSIYEKESHFYYGAMIAPDDYVRTSPDEMRDADTKEEHIRTAVDTCTEHYGLTPREKDILGYLLRGRDVIYISNDLIISKNTVATHIKHIYHKMGIHGKQELITLIEKMGTKS